MGSKNTAEHSRSVTVDPDYLLALQKYVLRSERPHRQQSRRKTMPPPKPPAAPPSASEAWSVEELCEFVQNTLQQTYGDRFPDASEVISNLKAQMIDGSRLKHLQLEDWVRICPCIGPRTLLMESIKKVGPALPPPPPPAPAAPPEAEAGPLPPPAASSHVEQILGLVPAVPKVKGNPPVPLPQPADVYDRGVSPVPPSPRGDVKVNVPVYRPPQPAQLPYRKLLTKRSKFSNHRLVDTPWKPEEKHNCLIQLWQIFCFEILRITFIGIIIRKFGFRPQQLPYIAAPLIATIVCFKLRLFVDFSPTLFTIIVVFPLSFSLNAAYQRREQALQVLASIKSSALAIHLFGDSWVGSQLDLPDTFVNDSAAIIKSHFHSLGHFLTATNEADKEVILNNIHAQYSDLFYHVDLIRLSGIAPPLVTVPFNNVINLMLGLEHLRVFSDYRTPCTLRSFCKSTIAAMGLCLAPMFANSSKKYGEFYGYMLCFVFFWLLLCMDNIQAMLENPFLTFGRCNAEDDINLSALKGVLQSKKKRKTRCTVSFEYPSEPSQPLPME